MDPPIPQPNLSFCPVTVSMLSHSLNNNSRANLVSVLVLGLVSAVGIAENALVLFVVGFRVRRTVSAVWVVNLALSDFLATLTLPLFTVYLYSSHSWELGWPLCVAQSSVFFLNMFVSSFLLAAISLDRWLLVCRPVWSQNRRSVPAAWAVCALGWAWAALNALPYAVFRDVMPKADGRHLCYHNFALHPTGAGLEQDCRARQVATAISKALLAFALPLAVIVGSYAGFARSLRRRERARARRGSTSGGRTVSRQFSRMVASVITAFALCWAPYHLFCLLEVVAASWPPGVPVVEVGLPLASFFSFLSPILNPVLYAFSCPDFCARIRQSLGALLEGLLEEEGSGGGGGRSGGPASRSALPTCSPPTSPRPHTSSTTAKPQTEREQLLFCYPRL
ncbi:hypothetical protein AAFF_G00293490 [Aldrovandia affinis]|uniref:G-protein coupled receptors family 1 profile domain-containing protein n=1 Tax=Aldrovandia affinis TaxID=143900 RepID=A0AAD7W1K2_9TELE|nr:hypothetical protein AAFF_G00293490 [Aldrovandia affinis]